MSQVQSNPLIERRRLNRADLITGCVFVILGSAIACMSWAMPRLEIRGIHPATVPGLVPGILGGVLALCGGVLAGKAYLEGRGEQGWQDFLAMFRSAEMGRFAVVAAMGLVYPLVLVGLIPFWLASAIFVFVFILVFETWGSSTPKPVIRSAVWALVQGVIVGVVVTLVFQYGFLVRLP